MTRSARAALAFVVALGATGCGHDGDVVPARSATATHVVRDCAGASVTLPTDVRRVVTTAPGLTDLVMAMGMGTTLVGVSDRDRKAGVFASIPHIPVYPTIPAESVAVLEPDLLLVDRVLSGRDVEALRARFPCTFVTDASHTLDRLRETFLRVGEALGRPHRGRVLAEELAASRKRAHVEGRPRVLVLGQVDPLPPYAIGPAGLLGDMVVAVGAQNIAWDLPTPSAPIASEVVVERAPEWILHTGGTLPDALVTAWASVPAIASGRVVNLRDDAFLQGGPQTAKALERLASILSSPR